MLPFNGKFRSHIMPCNSSMAQRIERQMTRSYGALEELLLYFSVTNFPVLPRTRHLSPRLPFWCNLELEVAFGHWWPDASWLSWWRGLKVVCSPEVIRPYEGNDNAGRRLHKICRAYRLTPWLSQTNRSRCTWWSWAFSGFWFLKGHISYSLVIRCKFWPVELECDPRDWMPTNLLRFHKKQQDYLLSQILAYEALFSAPI